MPNKQDDNYIWSRLAVLNTDTTQGDHIVAIKCTSAGRIKVSATDTISFTMIPDNIPRLGNLPVWTFQGTDGKLYPAVANSSGELLINY